MIRLRVHPDAIQEIFEVEHHYSNISARVVKNFWKEFDRALSRLTLFPDSHPRYYRTTRWVKLRRFPYLFVFKRIDPSYCRIIAFVHERQRPGYWRDRN